jgi:hypothetical protein
LGDLSNAFEKLNSGVEKMNFYSPENFLGCKIKIVKANQSLNKFGFPDTEWNTAKAEAKTILVAKARERGFITYSDLAAQVKTIHFDYDDERFFSLLGTLASEEEKDGRGLLSVLVVHKYGDMQPGKGFYRLAKWWGRKINDPVSFWVDEFNKVFAYWQKH